MAMYMYKLCPDNVFHTESPRTTKLDALGVGGGHCDLILEFYGYAYTNRVQIMSCTH